MDDLLLGTLVFVMTFLTRFIAYIWNKKRKKKNHSDSISVEMQYLVNRFNLDKKRIDKSGVVVIISLMDAIIITVALLIAINLSDNIVLELLIGIVVVFALILGINEIFGRILLKKGYGKNEL